MELRQIKGIGDSLEKKLHKLNICTVNDLLEYYPYRYNFINIKNINELNDEVGYIKVVVASTPKVQYIKRNFNRLNFMALTGDQNIHVVIFNRAFLKATLTLNKEIVLVGKYDKLKNIFTASDIKFNIVENKIEPIYHLSSNLNNKTLTKIIYEALQVGTNIDYIPHYYIQKYKFLEKNKALKLIHNPSSLEDIKLAQIRLKYEELFSFMFKVNSLKIINQKKLGLKRVVANSSKEEFQKNLEFVLTSDQILAIDKIYEDLVSEKRMNRLILGDVGSGKTIVATYAIYANFLGGYQSALMAPTEILAEQHYKNLKTILEKFNIKTSLLTGSVKKCEKDKINADLKNGDIDLIIGTHALISKNVEFKNLGLVITDEQHRFGVNARNLLQEKGVSPDMLYLSATPIPRTYALTIYGDLDLSIIKTKPKGRIEVKTVVKKEREMKDVLYKMLDELKLNHQIYVVAPLIEGSGENDLLSVLDLKEKLEMSFQHKVKIGIIHGKLKNVEKESIMEDYKNGKIKILISTTVIEVGIDVPNSTMMVIYNAEMFGLATLHQLRGRVGRSNIESYCYLISNKEIERLKVLEESNDGFYISERDLQMRGHGDLFGVKQSGDMTFKIADLKTDYKMLLQAKVDSLEYIEKEMYKDNEYYNSLITEINLMN